MTLIYTHSSPFYLVTLGLPLLFPLTVPGPVFWAVELTILLHLLLHRVWTIAFVFNSALIFEGVFSLKLLSSFVFICFGRSQICLKKGPDSKRHLFISLHRCCCVPPALCLCSNLPAPPMLNHINTLRISAVKDLQSCLQSVTLPSRCSSAWHRTDWVLQILATSQSLIWSHAISHFR